MLRPRQDWYQEELRISRGFCGAAFLERLHQDLEEVRVRVDAVVGRRVAGGPVRQRPRQRVDVRPRARVLGPVDVRHDAFRVAREGRGPRRGLRVPPGERRAREHRECGNDQARPEALLGGFEEH